MKISELVKRLEEVRKEHGDILVAMAHEWIEEVDSVKYYPEEKTGFYNNKDGVEYVAERVVVSSGQRDRIFFRVKE